VKRASKFKNTFLMLDILNVPAMLTFFLTYYLFAGQEPYTGRNILEGKTKKAEPVKEISQERGASG